MASFGKCRDSRFKYRMVHYIRLQNEIRLNSEFTLFKTVKMRPNVLKGIQTTTNKIKLALLIVQVRSKKNSLLWPLKRLYDA